MLVTGDADVILLSQLTEHWIARKLFNVFDYRERHLRGGFLIGIRVIASIVAAASSGRPPWRSARRPFPPPPASVAVEILRHDALHGGERRESFAYRPVAGVDQAFGAEHLPHGIQQGTVELRVTRR